jgi:choline-sulfatase
MHFNTPGKPGLHGLQVAKTEDVVQREWLQAVGPAPHFDGIDIKPAWRPFKDPARIWLNADCRPFPRRYPEMKGTWAARQATDYLQEHKDDQFALWVSFTEPHSPFDFPVEDRTDFKPGSFAVPRVGPEDGAQIPLIFRDLTPAEKQGIIAAYYTSVHYLDRNIGVVLDKLRQLKLENDTLVVYMADHGYSLGQHGRFEKHCCYDPALQVPLVMRWPGHIQSGRVVNDFTESIDVPPTITEVLRAERFSVNQGQSLAPYLAGKRPAAPRESIFSEYLENEEACIRTSKWKFIQCSGKRLRTDGYRTENPTPGRYIRLYDLESDPGEFADISARHPEVVQTLSGELLKRFRSTHPEAAQERPDLATGDAIDWYLRPRDAKPHPEFA